MITKLITGLVLTLIPGFCLIYCFYIMVGLNGFFIITCISILIGFFIFGLFLLLEIYDFLKRKNN